MHFYPLPPCSLHQPFLATDPFLRKVREGMGQSPSCGSWIVTNLPSAASEALGTWLHPLYVYWSSCSPSSSYFLPPQGLHRSCSPCLGCFS
jgi:hypothetical protein